ncbi:MAG: alpha amylase N-terminal ig-like domain-containing protein [Leptotrichiaceae bacterium]|nr:alpha amylase N-terminal ig-like domain-containing protein [Leptotrichiaceae bacterium]MBP6280834.1 alpha amylase N-terminal ig-like domain-containing protein [Leptotrichiaceae bacterium]MBP7100533.1 alpha amylase N-terminal ig-like domain-containing protein [Leptotrichiaceae bacterium]MBP7739338.1 alpha amylase N-terminal ig-like domain-containing protein [Leptotrichiaceae bacterium]MBP9629326.1 alpha amylase N-terminal ig-like domain-containing protein [Leptotrichiaceae bacterium]
MILFNKKITILLLIVSISVFSYSKEDRNVGNLSKYSQRDDNYIDLNSLYHEETSEFRSEDDKNVKIFMKTKNNDVYSVELIYGNSKKIMKSIGNYGGDEIFTAEVPKGNFTYYFKITDNKLKYYLGKNLETEESKIKRFSYEISKNLTNIPEWAKSSVGYQIYIDTFRNGNVDNDPLFNEFGTDDFSPPSGALRSGTQKKDLVAAIWGDESNPEFSVNEWNSNYETRNTWEENALNEVRNYTRYYGGDLQGIKEKIGYLKELGVEYIVISSPFYSLSNHKYDTIYFNHVDPYFGNIEQTGTQKGLSIKGKVHNNNGDKELNLLIYNPKTKRNLLNEDLNDINTWVWTDSDLELASLIKEAHANGLKIVLEVAPDITSNRFFANLESQKNWYLNNNDMILDLSNEQTSSYIENSLKKWILGPDMEIKSGIEEDGIDGIKYVYYDDRNKKGLVKITDNLKKLKKDLLILGDFSLKLNEDVREGVYDGGTDYNIVNNLIKYTVNDNSNYKIDGVEFASKLNEMYNKYTKERFNATQIYLGSLDTDRIYSGIINSNRVFDRNNQTNQGYLNIRPDLYDTNSVNKLKRIISVQMMLPSTPVIYYGDEKGMWGADSPRNRKPMLWEDYSPYENETDDISKYRSLLTSLPKNIQIDEVHKVISYPVSSNSEIENHYRTLLKIRKNYKNLLKNGEFRILEVYSDPKTKSRVDADIDYYLNEEKRKAKTYQNKDITPDKPNVDFISYEIFDKNKESIIVIINNSADSYPVNLLVPKLFGFYKNEMNTKEIYSISERKISAILRPYEVKILHSNDKNIIDSFRK